MASASQPRACSAPARPARSGYCQVPSAAGLSEATMCRKAEIMNKIMKLLITAGAALALTLGAAACGSAASSQSVAGNKTVRLLLSASGHQAVTPELNSLLPPGRLFPTGATFSATPGGWHQAGAYATETGILHEPGKPSSRVEIGLVRRHGRWLITFEGQL
jgi:hypothetical protein